MTVAASDLPAYLTRIFMDSQGEPEDQKRAASEAAKISQDGRLLLKKALKGYGQKVQPLSRLGRLIRAGKNGNGNGKAKGKGEGPTSDPVLNELIERVQKENAPPPMKRRRTAQAKWGDAEWNFAGTTADIIIVLVKFVPQTMIDQIRKAAKSPCRVILHTGRLETVAQEIERILAR